MAKSNNSFIKKQKADKKKKKRQEKIQRKQDRKDTPGGGNWEDMIAYIDENGNLSDKPPQAETEKPEDSE
jgi:aspartokinase-like uncharacterized kinase